jgi:hypothetical protein
MSDPMILRDDRLRRQIVLSQAESLGSFPSVLCRALLLSALEALQASELEVA